MNNQELEKILYKEKKEIEREIRAHGYNYKKVNKKVLALMITFIVVLSSLAFASVQLGIITWFVEQSHGYLDILDRYPASKQSILLKDDNFDIEVFGLVADEENTYLYVDMKAPNLFLDKVEIINSDDLYGDIDGSHFDDGSYHYRSGMSSVLENKQVYKFKAFEANAGEVIFKIHNIKAHEGETYPVDFEFKINFEKLRSKTVEIDKNQEIHLPEIDESLALHVDKIKFLPTATYVYFELEDIEGIDVRLGDLYINKEKLSPFLLGSSNDYMAFYPMPPQSISSLKWEIKSYSYRKYDLEMVPFENLPLTFDYEGHPITIESSIEDGYLTYTITDLGYKDRDYNNLDLDIYSGDVRIVHVGEWDSYEVNENDSRRLNDFGDFMMADFEKIRTKTYQLKSYESFEDLKKQPYYNEDDIELRIRHKNYNYNIKETITIYRNIKNWFKNIF